MKYLFDLSKLSVNHLLQTPRVKTGLGLLQTRQQISKDSLSVADIWQYLLPCNGFLNHRDQMVGDFAGADSTVATCPCWALFSNMSATRRNLSAFATEVPPNFSTRICHTLPN